MRIIIKVLLLLLLSITVQGQNLPGGLPRPTATPVTLPPPYTNATINFVRTWEPSMPTADTNTVIATSRTVAEVRQSTQYFDGLGRPLQEVNKGISPSGRDVVTPFVYDAYGREQLKYLPYVSQTSDGKFKTDPFAGQRSFYRDVTMIADIGADSIYYGQTDFESSPLNRVLKSYAPGNSWAKTGGNHPSQQQYLVNTTTDSVRIWYFTDNSTIPTSSSGQVYATGDLYKNVTINEDSTTIIEYKDKSGHMVLKKVQLSVTTGSAHVGWLCTYYCYDDLGNLRFVIPPLATEITMRAGWNASGVAGELCFQYQYDTRNRLTVKKIPGAGPVYQIYDVRDRLVFTQDSMQRAKSPQEWMTTFYDGQNRPIMTAIYKQNTTPAALQASLNTATSATQSISYTYPGVADLVLGNYDGSSSYTATQSIALQDGFDTGAGATVTADINPAGTNGTTNLTITNPLPSIAASDLTPLTYTFYDNYSYTGVLDYQSGDISKPQAVDNPYGESLPATPSTMINGLVTGTKVRVIGTDQWLTSTLYYNDKGRVIQQCAENAVGGKDITTSLYDFNGKVLSTYLRHTNPRSGITPQTTILTMMAYDAAGRLSAIKKRLNDVTGDDKTIVANTYNELGQLRQKRLGVTGATTQLDSLTYNYNIRGWLQGINKAFVNSTGSTTNWFGEELNYDAGFKLKQYNGNISGAKWKSGSDGIARAYGYDYDKVSRLTTADFSQQNSGSVNWTTDRTDFSVSNLSYDANGNIKTMTQKGMIGNAITAIDKLSYSYPATGSNKLSAVADSGNTTSAKLGDFINGTNAGNDYSYDGNGNLIQDLNKGISAISYNYLNLPAIINIRGKGIITYQYDAAGNKLKKTVTDSTTSTPKITVTDYIGGFVYEQDSLMFLAHEEGRIRAVYKTGRPVSYTYDFLLKDHIGNVRMVLGTKSDTAYYTATMETAASAVENALFSNIDNTRTPISSIAGYPTDNTTTPNAYVAKLNASTAQKIGPSLVLRVMAGDTIQVNATGVYTSTAANTSVTTPPDMISAILNAFSGSGISDGIHGAFGIGSAINTGLTTSVFNSLKQIDTSQNLSTKPKAYLNFALFDDQFALVNDNSGVRQIQGSPNVLQPLTVSRMVIKKTGFLYIYTNNESGSDVFFDNLVVVHNGGPVLEETHYYPFGLAMAGISNHALKGLNYPENHRKYNGIEYTDDLDLDVYDAQFRNLDPQLGRWNQIDPKIEDMEMWSPYASNYDNPIRYNDFLGDEPEDGPGLLNKLGTAIVQTGQQVLSAAAGATNAYVSNNLFGGGRIDVDNTGLTGGNAIAYQVGQKVGDVAAIYSGIMENAAAGVGEFFTAGGATAIAIPVALHGTATLGLGVKNLFSNPFRKVEDGAHGKSQDTQEKSTNGKNEKHGDSGRAKTKAEKQIDQYQEQLKTATGSEKDKIKQKIKNVTRDAAKKAKGVEHSRANKR
ncbi:RHS repeat-associated core domain-containing protein [Chitinophaga sp. YR573]|uniref:DUF6443 domain-containing protein n=1 Tax=Chitinophaga sp. YR573 TaxID=1881040 RepID=UPI0008C83533|nr:DUF6443 domain-containing protein [Chitinophaga sp. YR573]SEW36240.1 RHS repeat-associated core domain-containing protein [Chitinophaga sp. YR573]